MADVELLEELNAAATAVGRVVRLPAQLAEALVANLSEAFVTNDASQWWWQVLRVPSRRIEYGSGDGIAILFDLIKAENSAVLVVTEDTHPPLALYEGAPEAIVEVIRQCRFFEYAVAAPDAGWAVFDTHMNELIVVGRLVAA